ncbi:MAG: S1C family serine protease [Nitrososphaeraceae archaeon]
MTNSHVVADSKNIEVTFMDGNIYRARLMGSDPFTDIVVLYVQDLPKNTLLPLPLGASASVDIGQQIAAIGNPFGLWGSMTEGIINGLGRVLPSSPKLAYQYSIPSIIQIDTPINPGNSGGPLLADEVIRINPATGDFSGIGFAVPSNTISKVLHGGYKVINIGGRQIALGGM